MYILTYQNEEGEVVLYSTIGYETREAALKEVKEKYKYFDAYYPLIPLRVMTYKNTLIESNISEENTQN